MKISSLGDLISQNISAWVTAPGVTNRSRMGINRRLHGYTSGIAWGHCRKRLGCLLLWNYLPHLGYCFSTSNCLPASWHISWDKLGAGRLRINTLYGFIDLSPFD